MDYEKIYRDFIADRRTKEAGLTGYIEKHHILPRSLGGSDDAENMIILNAEDHYHAHCLLAKIYKGGMWSALVAMSQLDPQRDGKRAVYKNRRLYKIARKKAAKHCSKIFSGDGNPFFGKKHTKESLEKTSKKVINLDTGEVFDSQHQAAGFAKTTQSKISLCCSGKRTKTAGYRWAYFNGSYKESLMNWEAFEESKKEMRKAANLKRGNSNRGKKYSAERKALLSQALKGTKKPKLQKAVKNLENGKKFSSIKEAAKFANISAATLSNHLKGLWKTAGGYRWAYA